MDHCVDPSQTICEQRGRQHSSKMDNVPHYRNSSNKYDDDTALSEEPTDSTHQRLRAVLPLDEDERVATLNGQSEALWPTQQPQQTFASNYTGASKRQRQPANDPPVAALGKRSRTFNAHRATSFSAPVASNVAPLNAPVDSIAAAGMFEGSQMSSYARNFESIGSPHMQQHQRDVQLYSNPNYGLPLAANQESTFEQWRQQQMTRAFPDPVSRKSPPNLQPSLAPAATHFVPQLELRSQSVAGASEAKQSKPSFQQSYIPPTRSMLRLATEGKQPSPPLRQSSLPSDNLVSTLAQYNPQLRQQAPPQQQRHQLLPQQQQRQMAYDTMAPVSGTNTSGDATAATSFDMRSPLTFQSLPFQEPMLRRPPTLSPLEMLLLCNQLSSSTVPTTRTSPLALPPSLAGISLPGTNLTRHHGSTTIRPLSTRFYEPQSTARFRVADSMSRLRAEPRTFASLNNESQSAPSGESLPPTDETTSSLVLFHQQQQQQQQQHAPHDTASQWVSAPLGTDTDAVAALPSAATANTSMGLQLMSRPTPMEGRLIHRPSATTLSPLEMLYLSSRLSASQPTVDSGPQLAPLQQSTATMSHSGTTQATACGPQLPIPLADWTSPLTDWSQSASTLSEDQQPTMSFRQSPSPVHTAASTSNVAFLNQLQQRRTERQQELSLHAVGNTMAPARRSTAIGATVAARAPNPLEGQTPRPTSTTLSPKETQYWLHRLNSSTSKAQPKAPLWSSIPPPQQDDMSALQPTTVLEQRRPQIPQQLSDHAIFAQGGLSNLPMDNTSFVSWPTNQRLPDAFQSSYASRNDPTLVATSRATEAAVESTRAISDPIIPLPAFLARSSDSSLMSEHQTYLRCHIQLFCATMDDVTAPVRGRTKNIQLGQIGIQCCHCAHLPLSNRTHGAVYFPATTQGIYQAALNMGAMHLQCGRCPQMPDAMKQHFVELLETKNTPSMVGRKYWAKCAVEMFGLVDTENGIFLGNSTTAVTHATAR